MEKKYKQIEFNAGMRIEEVIQQLKDCTELTCGSFNDKMLYSDVDDVDSAYVKITGKTKAENDEINKKWHEEYKESKRKHKEAIPELTIKWIKEGAKILDVKYHEFWNKLVPIRLADLYEGMELEASLSIIKELNAGSEFEKVKAIIEEQGHSGMSYGLVCSMIVRLCDRGDEFVTYLKQ